MTSDDVLRNGRPDLSPGIYRGLLKEVVDGDGTGLFGAHAAGATVLNVAAGAFRSAGLCRVDGTVYTYVRDGDTLTITPALVAAADDGDPVESLTPSGEPEETRVAVIDLDMDGDPEGDVRAVISGDLAGYYPLGDVAAGALVTVKDTAYGYEVAGRPSDAPLLDGTFTYVPSHAAEKGSNDALADNTWMTIPDWTTVQEDRVVLDPILDRFTVLEEGMYDIRVGVSFAAGGSVGSRAVRMHYWDALGTDLGVSRMVKIPALGTTAVETAQYRGMRAGEQIAFEAWQNSGAILDILGSSVSTAPPATDCAIRWVGPL